MIITRQDPFSFRLQTGETIINFDQRSSFLELKAGSKRLSIETPGEYEMEGIAVEGESGEGVSYTIHWDDMVIGLGGTTRRAPYDILLLFVAKSAETVRRLPIPTRAFSFLLEKKKRLPRS